MREVIAHKFRQNNENFKIKWIFRYNETNFRKLFEFLSEGCICGYKTPGSRTLFYKI